MFPNKDRKMNHWTLHNMVFLITYAILLIWGFIHIEDVVRILQVVIRVLRPFIYGIMIAFVFQLPMKFFMRQLPETLGRGKKAIAILISFFLICSVIGFILRIVMPQIISNITALANAFPSYMGDAKTMLEELMEQWGISSEVLQQLDVYSLQLQNTIVNLIRNGLPHLLDFASGFASSVSNVVLAFVIAIYLIASKEKLLSQLHMFLYAFVNEKGYYALIKAGTLMNKTFSSFVSGQLLEALIIGILCYIGCLLMRFPYAPILSVLIAISNVVPIFGAIFGVGFGALLVAFIQPLQGFFFLIFGIVLQQVESNVIYPRIVGTTVGLSGLWVLFAITIGGGLFGFFGMLLGLPVFSIIYQLLREEMHRRFEIKKARKVTKKLE